MSTKINLPEIGKKRVVIIGGGFAGLTLAQQLRRSNFQVILLDKNNYHQFQPLFYQVAMAGLEPSSIVFPFRKLFQKSRQYFRMTEVKAIEPDKKRLQTAHGIVNFDYLVVATGADTNFFGNEQIKNFAIPMKSVSEALYLRNRLLEDYEKALTCTDFEERQGYIDIVIVGGGPTGVELAGALAELRRYIMPKDYPEINLEEIDIYLVEGSDRLLNGMSPQASAAAQKSLEKLGVKVILNNYVTAFDGKTVSVKNGDPIRADKVIWAAGVTGSTIEGLPPETLTRGNRYLVNQYSQIQGFDHIFALGDIAFMTEPEYPNGHPQVAQTAIQQARNLARNLKRLEAGKNPEPFHYRDLGSLATIGRNAAVADLGQIKLRGPLAWYIWLLVHLRAILGVKNKIMVLINWVWNYVTYDQSLRIIIRPRRIS